MSIKPLFSCNRTLIISQLVSRSADCISTVKNYLLVFYKIHSTDEFTEEWLQYIGLTAKVILHGIPLSYCLGQKAREFGYCY